MPGARRSHPRFLDRNPVSELDRNCCFRCTISDRESMGSGVQKVLDRSHGVETHGARRALKRGNFSHEHFFFKKNLFLIIKTVNNLSIFYHKNHKRPKPRFLGCVWHPGNRGFEVPTDRILDRNRFYTIINRGLWGVLLAPHRLRFMVGFCP